MAYNALNNLIDAYIYANGVQAITGQILNGVLKQMVSQLGSGYHLMGVAGPETTPEQNDFAMAYFAATAGEYTDFGGITLAAGEVAVLLTYGNGSWAKQTVYNVPTGTADLENTAGFITNAVTDLVNYYTKEETDTTLENYPTLEALATALADYYTKTQIDEQKAETDAAVANRYTKSEVDTKLGDYYRKAETYDKDEIDSIVAALSRQEYIVAWDGLSTPDVSAIPAGVTVTYSGTPYTGTLAASASTTNKIYMVWNGVAYDLYGTSADGGYSWVPMGTTSVDLSQYATKAEIEKIERKLFSFNDNIEDSYTIRKGWMSSGGEVTQFDRAYHIVIPIESGQYIEVNSKPAPQTSIIAFLSDYVEPTADNQPYNIIGSRYVGTDKLISPAGVKFLFVGIIADYTIDHTPVSLYINETNIISSISSSFFGIEKSTRELDIERNEFIIDSSLLFNGYWSGLSVVGTSQRIGNKVAFPVKKGDIIQQNAYGTYTYKPTVKDAAGNVLEDYQQRYFRTIIQNDGLLYFNIRNVADNTNISPDEVGGLISIYRSGNASFPQKDVIVPDMSDFVHGYINPSFEIAPHQTHYVNYKRIYARKGDYVIPVEGCMIVVHEYSLSGSHLSSSVHYYSSKVEAGDTVECGKYIVKNDECFIMCQVAFMTTSPGFLVVRNPSVYDGLASYAYPNTPSSPKKPYIVPMNISYSRYLQNGTFVGDKLYIQFDDYEGNKKILVVNVQTGAVEREMPFTWAKHGGMAYNQNNDILLVSNGGKLMFFEHPEGLSGTLTEGIANLVISTSYTYGVIAWGEDNQTVYWCRAYDGSTPETADTVVIDKIILESASGDYTGNFTVVETFSGSINEAVDCRYGYVTGNLRFSQDIDYDGYIYLAFGSDGQNFLVLDLIPGSGSFRVVGNYYWPYYTEDRVAKYLEPECVAINGGKLLCVSRKYDESLASVLLFDRTI